MRFPRLTIARLMIVVAVVAVAVAVARGLYGLHPVLMAGTIPTGIAVQLGLLRLVRSRGREGLFWAGFVAAGLAAVWSFVGAMFSSDTGPLWSLWSAYGGFVNRIPQVRTILRGGVGVVSLVAVASLVSLPQLLVALLGGLAARGIYVARVPGGE